MPVCPQCDNRPFANKEALLQHIRSSSAWHPFCGVCDRRFTSTTAYNAHMTAKHPPTWDCSLCERSYHAEFALEDHYRGSTSHPNCTACGQGFLDTVARDEHHRVSHDSREIRLAIEAAPYPPHGDGLQLSPEETKSICDLVDSDSLPIPTTHPQIHHSVEPVLSTGFTPLSPHNLAQRLIIGESAREGISSPDLTLEATMFASPLLDTKPPIFSPAAISYLPRPGTGFDEIWKSKENISNRSLTTSTPHSLTRSFDPTPLQSSSSVGLLNFSSRFSTVPRTGRDLTSFGYAHHDSFDRRLYPGSLRQRARLAVTDPTSSSAAPPSQIGFGTSSGTSTPRLLGSLSDKGDHALSSMDLDADITPTAMSAPGLQDGSPTEAGSVSVSSPGSSGSYFFSSSPKIHESDTRPTTANSSHTSPESEPATISIESRPSLPSVHPLKLPQVTISPISDTLSPNPIKIEPTSIASPKSPIPRSANLNPLHCRACLADSCDDITASMCGHIFCNRCITDAVIKTSRCPVCMTPTLLYCLFRLDLGA